MSKWTELKRDLIEERGDDCEVCGLYTATELHHALLGRRKSMPELNVKENAVLVCRACHLYADPMVMFEILTGHYKHMKEWLESLPLKSKADIQRYLNRL